MNANQIKTLSVRVLDFSPRGGSPGERLTTILDRCPDLLDLNIKIGIGMKVLDTVPWISREFSQLSASIPSFHETGWFDNKVPLYVLLLNDDNGMEIPIQSWCFGQFEYKMEPQMDYPTPQSLSLSNYNLSTPNINPNFVSHNMNTGLHMHYSANVPPDLNCFSIQDFDQQFEADSSSASRAHSLSQQVLQRVDNSNVVSEQEPSISEPNVQEITNIPYSTPLVTPANTVVPPFLNDLFFFPTYQPRLRMSTYTTHLRSSLESANYFPQAVPMESESQFWMLQHENQNGGHCNELVPSSSFNLHPIFSNDNLQDCNFDQESNQANKPNFQSSQVNPTRIAETSSTQTITEQLNEPEQPNPSPNNQASSRREIKETKSQEAAPPTKRRKASIKPNADNTSTSSRVLSKASNEIDNPPQPSRLFAKLQPRHNENNIEPNTRKSSDPDLAVVANENNTNAVPSKGQPHPLYRDKPFHGVLNKADLVISTDISVMVQDWTPKEIEAGRRLLRFQRRHEENTLYCQFEPITYEDYLNCQNSVLTDDTLTGKKMDILDQMVVSVIHWSGPSLEADGPERETSYYITSVDLVNLLEGLLGVVFTLEEKNRIRRNMELFNPITVGKGTDRTGELFRRIMAFPAPRPRNIEKGIKVFPFDQLPQALRKVVGKHTASRSSTLKVNLLPLETPSFS